MIFAFSTGSLSSTPADVDQNAAARGKAFQMFQETDPQTGTEMRLRSVPDIRDYEALMELSIRTTPSARYQ